MSRTVRHLLAVVLTLTGITVPAVAAVMPTLPTPTVATESSAASACATRWGSGTASVPTGGVDPVVSAGTGGHDCFDRVVFDVDGPAAGYHVEYVREVLQDGSGDEVPVPGGARLQVVLHHPAYDEQGEPTFVPTVSPGDEVADVRGYSTLRSVVYGGSFEGDTTFGVGVRDRLPYRVFTQDVPGAASRIVVDVAHEWS
jgi:hypothetical protein